MRVLCGNLSDSRSASQALRAGREAILTQDMEDKVEGTSGADIASIRRGAKSREMAIEEVRYRCKKMFSQNNVRKTKELLVRSTSININTGST